MSDKNFGTKSGSYVGINRRFFLGATAATGAMTFAGGAMWLLQTSTAAAVGEAWIEKSISELQELMANGQLTSRELTLGYLQRIAGLNPLLRAVLETNPAAVAIAAK